MKLVTQLFLASLIMLKIVLGSVLVYRGGLDPMLLDGDAIASEAVQIDSEDEVKDVDKAPQGADLDLELFLAKKAELRAEQRKLERKEAELSAIQDEINKKIARLTELRNEIRTMMAQKEAAEQKRIRHLIKAYSAMKPQQAATLVEKLDLEFAIELLSSMKAETVGAILPFVNVEKAAQLSEALGKRK
jgi:flagellar motility protein MotE (MotC chaperone)